MNIRRVFVFVFVLLALLTALWIMPAAAQNAAECVTEYDAEVDYFPEKAELDYVQGFTVEYFNNYKVINAFPYFGASEAEAVKYVLVQCGTPAPEGFDDAYIVEVPVQRVIALSTTYLPHFAELGAVDTLIGLDTFTYTTTAEVVEKIEAGELVEVGGGASGVDLNVEVVLNSEPDLVMTDTFGDPATGVGATLDGTGITVATAPDYLEATPLGRAEWIKYTALFLNAEGAAETLFDQKVTEYQALIELAANVPEDERVVVLTNTIFADSWYIPGVPSYTGQLIVDAGGVPAMSDDPQIAESPFAVPYSFEAVYEGALDADVWLANVFNALTREDLIAQDARYADFAALQSGRVYNNNKRTNGSGGSDFYESGVTNPHIVLADLIAIFYPDLLPDHELYYFVAIE